jgi:hypothetical protein
MSIISWFYVWSCLKIHLLRLRHLLLPVLLKAHWPFVLDAQLTHQTLPLTCDCQTRLTRQHHRGPGLRTLFAFLRAADLWSYLLRRGLLIVLKNGMALLRRTFWAEPCIGKSTNWNVLGVDSFTSLYPCEKSDSWERFYPVFVINTNKKIRQYKMNTLYKIRLIYCYLWLKRHFYFY